MYKNQLQELAQRSCFNLPSYTCVREGPDHAPRFKSAVNFNGEVFESPGFFTTLRQAEHAAAEVALQALSRRGPSHSLAARVLDETGVYKNLLQEVSQRVGASLPSYTTVRSGLGHLPVFTCTVELAGIQFTGEPAKNKKQAEKNAAMAAWSSLKQLAKEAVSSSSSDTANNDELEHVTIARALLNYRLKEKMAMANNPYATPFPKKFPVQLEKKPSQMQPPPATGSKILPLIRPNSTTRSRPMSPSMVDRATPSLPFSQHENRSVRPHKFPAAGAAPYVPVRHFSMPYHSMVQPVTMRTAVPVFSAPPPLPPPSMHHLNRPVRMASPVCVRPAIPILAVPPPVPAISPALPVVGSLNSPISFQLKKQSPVVASRDLTMDQVKEQPLVVEALIDCSVAPVQVKNSPLAVTAFPVPASPVRIPDDQLKELPPSSVRIPDDQLKELPPSSVRIPDDQLKELPPVSAIMPPVHTEDVDGLVKDPEGVAALEHLERLEI